jgi:hypothetical protein
LANCVANAGRIESGDSYKFYAEGVTPAVALLYAAIDAERVAVAAALGASVPNRADWLESVYGVRGATLVETCQQLTDNSDGPYQATGTPKSLDHKFITEDVPTGLIPMSALGAAAGVDTPAIDALVEVVRSMTGKDFAAEGRTLERLGLNGMDAPQIRRPSPTSCCQLSDLAPAKPRRAARRNRRDAALPDGRYLMGFAPEAAIHSTSHSADSEGGLAEHSSLFGFFRKLPLDEHRKGARFGAGLSPGRKHRPKFARRQ